MAWLTSHLRTLFANKTPKNPPKHESSELSPPKDKTKRSKSRRRKGPTREEKGKGRALDSEYAASTATSSSSHTTNSSAITDSDLLPILHYTELHLVPQILTQFPAFYIVGHPLPPAPLAQAKQILTSSDEVKAKLIHPRKSTVRGYNSAKSSGREWWDYSPEESGTKLNLDDEEFRVATKEYFEQSIALLQRICAEFNTAAEAEGQGVVVPEEIVKDAGFSTMRYLRYSPTLIDSENKDKEVVEEMKTLSVATKSSGASSKSSRSRESSTSPPAKKEDGTSLPRMEAHTDHGVLTLMTATEPSGLYVWDRNGKIFSAPPIENTVLVIAGDLMTHFTAVDGKSPLDGEGALGDKTVLPTVHAVVIPKGAGERYSVAVFLRPKKDLVVSKKKTKKEGSEEVEEMTFGRWAEEKGNIRGRRCWMLGQDKLSGGEDI
ncbi:hypothetical protein TWF694_004568 [Orbilia ellipsospora]|uniref:Fe2OG dioxygenase domain-containing protein n=1 Tax=Orbilia ellipsospora TaxID=2528407 RepID=A0AAV9WVM7_9PEZI